MSAIANSMPYSTPPLPPRSHFKQKQVKQIRLADPSCLTWQPPDKALKEKVNKHNSDRSLTERSLNI